MERGDRPEVERRRVGCSRSLVAESSELAAVGCGTSGRDQVELELGMLVNSKEHVTFKKSVILWMDLTGLKLSSSSEQTLLFHDCESRFRSVGEFGPVSSACLNLCEFRRNRKERIAANTENNQERRFDRSSEHNHEIKFDSLANCSQSNSSEQFNDCCNCYYCSRSRSRSRSRCCCKDSLNSSAPKYLMRQLFSELLIRRLFSSERAERSLKKNWLPLLLNILSFVFFIYICCKQLLVAVLVYESQISQEKLNPQVRAGANRTKNCAFERDIFYNRTNKDFENFQSYLHFYASKNSIGFLWHVFPGFFALTYMMLGLICLTMGFMGFFVESLLGKTEVHHLNFALNPLAAKRRLKCELIGLINSLIQTTRVRLPSKSKNASRTLSYYYSPLTASSGSGSSSSSQQGPGRTIILRCKTPSVAANDERPAHHNSSRLSKAEFHNMLLQIVTSNLVIPRPYMTDQVIATRKKYAFFLKHFIIINTIILTSIGCAIGFVEHEFRVRDRLNHFECLKFSPDAIPIKRFAYLPPLLSEHDRKAYEDYDESYLSYLYLAIVVELKFFLTPIFFVTFIETLFISTIVMIWVAFYINLYLHSYSYKIVWLKQILELIEQFPTLMQQRKGIIESKLNSGETVTRLQTEATRALIVGYLNFELFRRQHKAYKVMSNHLLLVCVLCLSEILILSYYIRITMKDDQAKGLIACSYLCVFAIISFQLCGAIISKKIEQLMRNIFSVLACAADNSICTSYPVELWRRQALNERDAEAVYSLRLAGAYVSYKNILTSIAQLICFVLLFLCKDNPGPSFISF